MQDLKMTGHTARRESTEQDVKSVPYERLNTKCLRVPVTKIFTSLAKKYYYYNTTYLFSLKAHRNPIIFQILVNHINIIIVMKLC